MLKTSFIAFSTLLKLLSNVINTNKVDVKYGNKAKNLPTFSNSQWLTKVDYLIFNTRKTFDFL